MLDNVVKHVISSAEPIFIKKNDHICQARLVTDDPPRLVTDDLPPKLSSPPTPKPSQPQTNTYHSEQVSLDPDGILSPDDKVNFLALLKEFDHVSDPTITGYNGAAGPIKGVVNMCPVQPPQRKGRMPQYARDQLEQLRRDSFDEC